MQTTMDFLDAISKENITVQECLNIWMLAEDTCDLVASITARELRLVFPDRASCEIPSSKVKIISWLQVSLTIKEKDALTIVVDPRVAGKHFKPDSPIKQLRAVAKNANQKLNDRFNKLMNLTYGNPDAYPEAPSYCIIFINNYLIHI